MNKKILLTLLLICAVLFSVSTVCASDVNVTDSETTSLVDDVQDVSVPQEDTADSSEDSLSGDADVVDDSSEDSLSSDEVIESEDSNNLSTNLDSDTDLDDGDEAEISQSDDSDVQAAGGSSSSKISSSKTIKSKDVTKYYKGSAKYKATFLNSNGKALANKEVKITVNGKTYTKTTNSKGVVTLDMNLKPGTYKVVSKNPVTGYTLTTTFKILSTIKASNVEKVYTDGRKFTAKFLKSNGKPLANRYVKFRINGNTYTEKTNKKGIASLTMYNLEKGKYKIISYNVDGLKKTNKVTVYNRVSSKLTTYTYTFLTKESKKIKVRLLNGLGYAPGQGKIIKMHINGKTYAKKTNSRGYAYFKLPALKKGVYTVKYKFAGNVFYKQSKATGKIAIIPTKVTKLTVKSPTTYTYGSGGYFKVKVTAGGVALPNKIIKFKVNGKTYTKTTNSKGLASIKLGLVAGEYKVSYSLSKTSKTKAKSGSTKITVKDKSVSKHNAYWLYGSDMKSVKLSTLSSKGVTDILLNFKAYELYGKSDLESWITDANAAGIKVHLWVQAFYSGSTGWVNPLKNGKVNTEYFTQKINEIKKYSAVKGISGIHLDYMRYSGSGSNAAYKNSGGTAAITSFLKQAVSAVDSVNSKLKVSVALMPETTSSAKYYGQDYSAISNYADIVIPMIYKGNYGKDTSWITTTAQWYVKNSKGAAVWAGLQTYASDEDTAKLSTSALSVDIKSAYSGGASGVVLFRYGISNSIDFNNLKTTITKTISIKDVVTGAYNLKAYYAANKKLPSTVTAGGIKFTVPEFLYVMNVAISKLSNSKTGKITALMDVSAPSSPTGDTINSKDLSKANYVKVAENIIKYIKTNKQAPNYASSAIGKIIYSELVDSASRILAFYKTNSRLPSYVTVKYSSSSGDSGSGLNEKNTISNLKAYLAASKNCEVNNAKIKSLVSSLTKGLTTAKQKATAIFNYVRDTLSYSFYYNTKYGAVGTLNAKKGNCVDHAHLLTAMFRTAGLATRYVHGTCTFSSGSTYGHVWTQVLINGKWVVADATSSRNSLGSISNWNTKSFTLNGKYASLSF